MKLLIKQASIIEPNSSHNQKVKDLLINNGIITAIADSLEDAEAVNIIGQSLVVTAGFTDVFAHFNDPGFEFKETIESGCEAAMSGGFTRVMNLPNTSPSISGKTNVEYCLQKANNTPVYLHPLGAVTKNVEGKELAEMYDMFTAGASAFSDGLNPIQSSGLLLKALQYVKAFNGTVIQLPIDKSIGANGLMNEGVESTRLGLPGIPALAEELIVKRDLDLLRYTESKLHITGISTEASVRLIEAAKKEGLQITCSITPYHLCLDHTALQGYDTNMKVNPPLRTIDDVNALKEALKSGIIDCIATHHLPQNLDSKICEFEYAKFGMIGLQSAFSLVNNAMPELTINRLAQIFSYAPRNIFNLPATNIEEGMQAELTVFSKEELFTYSKKENRSKSVNSPFFEQSFQGKIKATISKNHFQIN